MEIEITTEALNWLSTLNTIATKLIIVSDSDYVAQGIQQVVVALVVLYVAISSLQELVWIYCQRHAGVRANEKAGSLVSKAPYTGSLEMRSSDMLRAIRVNLMRSETATEETIERAEM